MNNNYNNFLTIILRILYYRLLNYKQREERDVERPEISWKGQITFPEDGKGQ